MGKFDHRSTLKEMMDFPIEDRDEIFQNFEEIITINKYLGGANHSWSVIHGVQKSAQKVLVDIGSGACDFFNYVSDRSKRDDWQFLAVELMPEANAYARQRFPKLAKEISFIEEDYRVWIKKQESVDIIHASLFCHHLCDNELVEFFECIKGKADLIVINDLHRHPLAYYSIMLITKLFSKSRFTKNDAPLSVLRGFKRKELEAILSKAQITNYSIQWKWAFRFIITISNE